MSGGEDLTEVEGQSPQETVARWELTVARWELERPDLAELSRGEVPRSLVEELTASEAFVLGAMVGQRLVEVKEGRG